MRIYSPFLTFLLSNLLTQVNAQQLEKLYVNLYTDSLKRGTWNYINVDGQFSNGRFLPLDSTHLIYQSSVGVWEGNKLWLPDTTTIQHVVIYVQGRKNPTLDARFTVGIKQLPDPALPSEVPVQPRRRNRS